MNMSVYLIVILHIFFNLFITHAAFTTYIGRENEIHKEIPNYLLLKDFSSKPIDYNYVKLVNDEKEKQTRNTKFKIAPPNIDNKMTENDQIEDTKTKPFDILQEFNEERTYSKPIKRNIKHIHTMVNRLIKQAEDNGKDLKSFLDTNHASSTNIESHDHVFKIPKNRDKLKLENEHNYANELIKPKRQTKIDLNKLTLVNKTNHNEPTENKENITKRENEENTDDNSKTNISIQINLIQDKDSSTENDNKFGDEVEKHLQNEKENEATINESIIEEKSLKSDVATTIEDVISSTSNKLQTIDEAPKFKLFQPNEKPHENESSIEVKYNILDKFDVLNKSYETNGQPLEIDTSHAANEFYTISKPLTTNRFYPIEITTNKPQITHKSYSTNKPCTKCKQRKVCKSEKCYCKERNYYNKYYKYYWCLYAYVYNMKGYRQHCCKQ